MKKYISVEDFLADLDDTKKAQVLKVREYILATEPTLEEHIKWNAPSYILNGEDRITFNLLNKDGVVQLVLHMGAKRKEDKNAGPVLQNESSLITWASDIRGYLSFRDINDVLAKEKDLKRIVEDWLAIKI